MIPLARAMGVRIEVSDENKLELVAPFGRLLSQVDLGERVGRESLFAILAKLVISARPREPINWRTTESGRRRSYARAEAVFAI